MRTNGEIFADVMDVGNAVRKQGLTYVGFKKMEALLQEVLKDRTILQERLFRLSTSLAGELYGLRARLENDPSLSAPERLIIKRQMEQVEEKLSMISGEK